MSDENGKANLRALLGYLKTARGFDFSVYKPTTLIRRVAKRLQTVGAMDYKEYMDYLEVHPEEFTALFNTILINVTSFFRDTAAWDYLRRDLVPRIVAEKGDDAAIRVWSAGCSSGEEAYSLAMTFCDALGLDAFRRRVKIYATDIDEEALIQARQGRYARKDLEPVPKEWCETSFEADDRSFVVKADLRRAVVFGRHDLVRDAPISRMDLLVCRNTLMYFNAETQAQVLGRFHFALNDNGFLFLGKAEMALASTRLFGPVDIRLRIFHKVPSSGNGDNPVVLTQPPDRPEVDRATRRMLLRQSALEAGPCAQIVLDAEGHVAAINDMAQNLFGLGAKDLDQPFQNLEVSYRPAELRSLIQKAVADRKPVALKDVPLSPKDGIVQYLDIEVKPLFTPEGLPLGSSIAFVDSSSSHQLTLEIERARQEQETANEELQSANEELQTTNEELQSTVEELQTTNEELQSTNEEMETMNEELRSTNEELRGANDQLRSRTEELDVVNSFTQSLLSNVSVAIIAVDPELKVALWNKAAKSMWGLDADEVRGRPFLDLGIGLPVERLAATLRTVVAGGTGPRKTLLSAVDRRGKPFKCRVTVTPGAGTSRGPFGAVLVMEED
jgi:two-component system, chemotaxis family, CheB/CheR fusion protein